MKLFDEKAVSEFLSSADLLQAQEHWKLTRHGGDIYKADLLDRACKYFSAKYPGAAQIDIASAGTLVDGFTRGLYGGFGTESYEKETKAEAIILAFAGGVPAIGDSILSRTPPMDRDGNIQFPCDHVDWTKDALGLLESFYFGDGEKDVLRMICKILNESKREFSSRLVARARRMIEAII